MDINDVYNFMVYIVRKQRGVFLPITDAMQALDHGQLDAVEYWFTQYGTTQTIHDAIRKLRTPIGFASDSSGKVTFEDDYIHLLGIPYTVYGSTISQITFVNDDEYPFARTSELRAPTIEYPIAVNSEVGFTLYPATTYSGAYWYLRRPAVPVLSVTTVGRVITYDSLTSVQLEFTDVYINNIIANALVYVGVNFSEQQVMAFAEVYKKETSENG